MIHHCHPDSNFQLIVATNGNNPFGIALYVAVRDTTASISLKNYSMEFGAIRSIRTHYAPGHYASITVSGSLLECRKQCVIDFCMVITINLFVLYHFNCSMLGSKTSGEGVTPHCRQGDKHTPLPPPVNGPHGDGHHLPSHPVDGLHGDGHHLPSHPVDGLHGDGHHLPSHLVDSLHGDGRLLPSHPV